MLTVLSADPSRDYLATQAEFSVSGTKGCCVIYLFFAFALFIYLFIVSLPLTYPHATPLPLVQP